MISVIETIMQSTMSNVNEVIVNFVSDRLWMATAKNNTAVDAS